MDLQPTWITQDDLIPRYFITSAKTFFLNIHMFWVDISFFVGETQFNPNAEVFIHIPEGPGLLGWMCVWKRDSYM